MKVERWEEESDEEWAERLAEEISLADDPDISKYFVERDSYDEEGVIINYIGEKGWTWKEHPEGPFKATQIIEWKNKAEKWDTQMAKSLTYAVMEQKLEAIKQTIKDVADGELSPYDGVPMDRIREILQTSTQSTITEDK